jgi:hypothetical protein
MINLTDYQRGKILFILFLLIPPLLVSFPASKLTIDLLASHEMGISPYWATRISLGSLITMAGSFFMLTLPYVAVLYFWSRNTGQKEYGSETMLDGFGRVFRIGSVFGALI